MTSTSARFRTFHQACCQTVWEPTALSESGFDLALWLQGHGVSADQPLDSLFCKWLPVRDLERLEAEVEGLQALMPSAGELVLPRPLAVGPASGRALLVLDRLPLGGADPLGWQRLGRCLARLHRRSAESGPGVFGWAGDRWIGAGIQRGGWDGSWGRFFCRQRLGDQFTTLARQGLQWQESTELMERLEPWLNRHQPSASLVHGDLWPGNADVLKDGQPCIFDPAVSYSDREVDVAMASMFGGLPRGFFEAYNAEWPLPAGAEQRRIAYNLFHLLNHANLFGGSYIASCGASIRQLLQILRP